METSILWPHARRQACALALFLALPVAAANPPGADLDSVHSWLRQHNSALLARTLDAEAAAERIGPAGALPDPMFEMELDGIDFDRPRALPAQVETTVYRVRQQFPLWGKRALAREVATHEAAAAGFRREATLLELVEQADMAWLTWWHAQASATAIDRVLGVMAQMRELARTRYAAGLAPQQDAIRADVELTSMRRMQIELVAQGARARSTLNARLGRNPQDVLTTPAGEPEIALDLPLDELLADAAERHPMTQAEASMRAARLGMAEEVRRERLPDIGVGLGLMQMGDRAEGWELMFEVEIPLQQGARRQRERAADLRAEAAGAREQAIVDELRGRVGAAYAMWQSAGEQESLVSGQLLPQAQAGLESALAGYQVGAVDFDTLLQALTLTLNAERDRLDARRDRLLAAVELKLLQGKLP